MAEFSGEARDGTGGEQAHLGPGLRPWLLQPLVHIGLILGLGLAIYLHTLHAPFLAGDDYFCIVNNPAIRSFDYFLDFNKVRDLPIWVDIKNSFALRPVVYLTFALNYRFGGLNEFGFHLVNIAIHLLNATLVYLLARVTLERAPLHQSDGEVPPATGLIPLLVALLFVSHPLQTQAVTYINQRFTSLATLFYFAVLLLYIAARSAKGPPLRRLCYALALLLTVVAMKTKAIAFTLPVMMLLYDLFFLDGGRRQRFLLLAPFFLTLLVIPGTLIWLVATDGVDDPRSRVEQSIYLANYSGTAQWDYLKTQFGVIATYLRLFILPVGQNLIPLYPNAQSFFEPKTLASFLLLLTLFGGGIWLGLRSYKAPARSAEKLIAFGILWFFVTIAMSSSIIPLDVMLLEYRVYLPSFGFFLVVSVAAVKAVARGWIPPRIFAGAASVIIVTLAGATYARNDVYTDTIRIFSDTLAKNPHAIGARIGLATSLLDQKNFEEAIIEFDRILKELPNDSNMNLNLGYALAAIGRTDEAIAQYLKALEIWPDNSYAYGNLGFAYLEKGMIMEAEKVFLHSLSLDPHFGGARLRLAQLYEQLGRTADAIAQYRQLLNSHPNEKQVALRLEQLENSGR